MIQTKRLWIKDLTVVRPEHIAALNNKEHMRYSGQRRLNHTRETQHEYVRNGNGALLFDILMYYGTFGKTRFDVPVGTMRVEIDKDNSTANMGIMILPPHAGKGYGQEAWGAVMEYLFRLGISKIEAGMHDENYSMRKICVNSLMHLEGWRDKHFLNDDGTRSSMVMFGRCNNACLGG